MDPNTTYHNKAWLEEQYIIQQKPVSQIAKELSVTHGTVNAALKHFEIPSRSTKDYAALPGWRERFGKALKGTKTKEGKESISQSTIQRAMEKGSYRTIDKMVLEQKYILEGKSIAHIGEELGVGRMVIHRALQYNNISIRGVHSRWEEDDDDEVLRWWSTWSPNQAYLLGFIFADGSVREGRDDIEIAQKDYDFLVRLQSIIPGHNSRIVPHGTRNGMYALIIRVRGLREIMQPYGIVPRKTYVGWFPDSLPDEYAHHYIRGFFDGDGCIHECKRKNQNRRWSVGLTCHLEQYLVNTTKRLSTFGIPLPTIYKFGVNYSCSWGARNDIIAIRNVLYKDASLYLHRKRIIFDEAIEYFDQHPRFHAMLKWSPEQAREIQSLYATGNHSFATIAKIYGVPRSAIRSVVSGATNAYRDLNK